MRKSDIRNPGCRTCTVETCDATTYRGNRCLELRAKAELNDPSFPVFYEIQHNNVRCISVDWERDVYIFEVNGKNVGYKPPHYISAESEEENICKAIDMYLDEIAQADLSQQPGQDARDAEAIIRLFPYADKDTTVWRENTGNLWVGVYGCWTARISSYLFLGLKKGQKQTLADFLNDAK